MYSTTGLTHGGLRTLRRSLMFGVLAALATWSAHAAVVINELHINPDLDTEPVEFVELHNTGAQPVNIGGWTLSDGVFYQFPTGATIPANGYVIVSQNSTRVRAKWGLSATGVYGPFEGKLSNDGERLVLFDTAGNTVDEVTYGHGFPWPTVGDPVPPDTEGTAHSMQLLNPSVDNDLGGAWRSAAPTPRAPNASYLANLPPMIRQVVHTPEQPRSNEPVTISAKVTDSDGVQQVMLLYQIVEPGNYIELSDPEYQTQWTEVQMLDNGQNGDLAAGDDIYSVQLPASVQKHRRLIRYRIRVRDNGNRTLTVPYADDPQPNFAYFVYDGVPDWTASWRPGVEPEVTFKGEDLSRLPVYHLISKKTEVENATWLDKNGSSNFAYDGTLVYDGVVYDHIRFRMRGGVWRFAMGKNMWKFDFNRGHYFQARDNYGNRYPTKWNQLNLGACIQQGDNGQRGEQGLYESVGFELFRLAGLESSFTHFVHFRIIDEQGEDGRENAAHPPFTESGTQYDGDFWGLYLAVEELDGRFLDAHGLPDGNLFKMENYWGELKNQNPDSTDPYGELREFIDGYSSRPTRAWWENNVDLERYFNYRSIVEAIHHYDIGYGKNYFYYRFPTNGKWATLVWDIDLTWDFVYGNGEEPMKANGIFNSSAIEIAYQNCLREIRDLLFNPEQTGQLIEQMAAIIDWEDSPSMVEADRAMWDYHWVMSDAAARTYTSNNNKSGQGRFYQSGVTRDFRGMVQKMKNWVVSRGQWIDETLLADNRIPNKPTITYEGPEGFPPDQLIFRSSSFSDPQGNQSFGAQQWRIAEVLPADQRPGQNEGIQLVNTGDTWRYFLGSREASTPMAAWRALDFNDGTWQTGNSPLGWGEAGNFLGKNIVPMGTRPRSFYMRKKFSVADPEAIGSLTLSVMFDDGINVWLNGTLVASINMTGENVAYNEWATAYNEPEKLWHNFELDPALLQSGENILAIQIHDMPNSSDCFGDARLVAKPQKKDVAPLTGRAKYEIEATWVSDISTTFQPTVQIPFSVVRTGRTYRARVRHQDNTGRWSHWSDPVEFVAGEPTVGDISENLRVTELMYAPLAMAGQPYEDSDYEFIELANFGNTPLDVSGVSIVEGIDAVIPMGQVLQPGEYGVIVRNAAAFRARYGNEPHILAEFSGRLSNDGELISIQDAAGRTIIEFTYNDGREWPQQADGAGHSLVPLEHALEDPDGDPLDYALSWRPSTYIHGSPGEPDPAPPASVVINEVMAHTDHDDLFDSNDWIEIYNPTDQPITLENYYLSDDVRNPKKWPIPTQVIQPRSWLTFDEVHDFHIEGQPGFGLSKYGEHAVISYLPGTAKDRIVDMIRFEGQENDISVGRYLDGAQWVHAMAPSRGTANTPPLPDVVISEVMYHPPTPDEVGAEFVEIYNPTSEPIALFNETGPWRLEGAVTFDLPAGQVLQPGGRALMVGFDPVNNPAQLAQFLASYGLTEAPGPIWGPWLGSLSNRTERLALQRPEAPDLPGDPVGWVIVDEVLYFDRKPFDRSADGDGPSLHRRLISGHGWNPESWVALPPTPGTGIPADTTADPAWLQLH